MKEIIDVKKYNCNNFKTNRSFRDTISKSKSRSK